MKALVAVAGLLRRPDANIVWNYNECFLNEAYPRRLAEAGALPVILPYLSEDRIEELLAPFSAVLIPGGMDLDPAYYHEAKKTCTECPLAKMDSYQMALIKTARRMGKWLFGICRGFQGINVALGGSLYQDIAQERPGSIVHMRKDSPYEGVHKVKLAGGSRLQEAYGAADICVNSLHHQGIKKLGEGLRATAVSEDGIVEGIEGDRILAVQWHPEALEGPFFDYIVSLLARS